MSKFDIVDNYESLLIFMSETAEALNLVRNWLNKEIKPDDKITVHGFLSGQGSHLAVLNLAINRFAELEQEHRQIINACYKEK